MKKIGINSKNYIKNGFLVLDIKDKKKLLNFRSNITFYLKKILKNRNLNNYSDDRILNEFHKYFKKSELNDLRVKVYNYLNSLKSFKENYYDFCKDYLYEIVGNELVMQQRINLSIQLPNDKSSLLPIHSDTWSGDSPFETVVWIPMVNCYKSKSMYIIKPEKIKLVNSLIKKNMSTDKLFLNIKKYVNWINIKYGQVLIFNKNLPHGNIVNEEKETRWSFNCRFKSLFSPYGDKKLGEFFEPIEIKPASKIGMIYKYPKV